jgi:uncharacterized protein (TIRG00374 family)
LRKPSISSTSASSSKGTARRLRWSGLVGAGVTVLLLWWTLHDVDLGEVWQRLRGVHLLPLLAAILTATASFPARAIRWRYLLRSEGSALPFIPLWHATAIGFMANNVLPARAGEFARAYAARRLTGVRFSTAFASIAVERVMDGITLAALLMAGIWAGGFAPGTAVGGVTLGGVARGGGAFFGVLLAIALFLVHWPRPALRIAERVSRTMLPQRWSQRLMKILEGLLSGLDALRSPRQFATVTFWSFVVWLVAAGSFWLAFLAFEIDVPWSAALLLQGLIAFGVALPSSPGFFGPFEAIIRVTLALYGIEAGLAVSYAVGYHLGAFIPITLLGIWSLTRAHLHLAELRTAAADEASNAHG